LAITKEIDEKVVNKSPRRNPRFSCDAFSNGAARLRQAACVLFGLTFPTGGAGSPQLLDKPERPDHEEREEENSSTRKERRCKTCGHDILQGVLIACSLDWCTAIRGTASPIRQPPPRFRFKNWRRPGRKNPCFRERRPWQRRHISNHGWNRTRPENPTHWCEHAVEFASMRLHL
jgi:hypothetical protein